MRRFNVLAPAPDRATAGAAGGQPVAEVVGAEQIGARLYELAEGEQGPPYHFHHGAEEWLIVVAGAPRVRTPDGERVLAQGDVLCCPAGPAGAHRVSGPGTVLIVSEKRDLDVVEYPGEGTIELRPSGRTFRSTGGPEGG